MSYKLCLVEKKNVCVFFFFGVFLGYALSSKFSSSSLLKFFFFKYIKSYFIFLNGKIILLIQTYNRSINPRYKLLKIIKRRNNIQVNSIINWYQAYKFDNIVTIIFWTLVLQHIENHNLIY